MCLLYFCPFKTVLNKGSKELQEDGRGCGGIGAGPGQGSNGYGPVQSLAPSFRAQVNIFGSWGILGWPFPALSIPADAVPAPFQSVGQEFPSPAEFRRTLQDCFVPIQLQKARKSFEQFVSEWYFYLSGNAQTFKHRLYFCINSKWMISEPWIKSLGTMVVKLALYWWCHLIVPALCLLPCVSTAVKVHCGCSGIPVT